MKGMILAAGKGTRVRPLTHDLPKAMIPILGKPVMEYLIEHLAAHDVRQLMINTSHQAERIEQYFGDGRRFGVEIGYSFEGYLQDREIVPFALGSAGGMRRIQDFSGFFDDTTVVVCGDALIDLDIRAAVAEHRARGALASVVTREVPWQEVSSYGVVVADREGRIRSFQEKPAQHEARSNWISTGIYIFEPAVLDLIPSNEIYDIGSQLFPRLVELNVPFYALRRDFHWIDIGRVADYWQAIQRVMRHEIPWIRIPGQETRPGVWTGLNVRIDPDVRLSGPVYLASGCHVESGCEIVGPAWIGHGCHVKRNARIVRSVVFEHTRVVEGASFVDQIVYGDYCVSSDGETRCRHHLAEGAEWSDARLREERAAPLAA